MSYKSTVERDSTHVYYNLTFQNINSYPLAAVLSDSRTENLIDCAKNWEFSIIRFDISGQNIPLFVWQNTNDVPNNTYYSVTISYLGNNYQVFLVYSSESNFPSFANYIFSYNFFARIINVALNAAYLALKSANPGASVTSPPFMQFDTSLQLYSLIGEVAYAQTTNPYSIYFNTNLAQFFGCFDSFQNSYNDPNGKDLQILVYNKGNNDVSESHGGIDGIPVYTAIPQYQMQQEDCCTFLVNSARSIVFISSDIPVKSEYINIRQNSTSDNFRQSLTDLEISQDKNNSVHGQLLYVPFGEYRMITLQGDGGIRLVNISVYWQDKAKNIYPLYLSPFSYVSIKMMFRKKKYKSGL